MQIWPGPAPVGFEKLESGTSQDTFSDGNQQNHSLDLIQFSYTGSRMSPVKATLHL